MTSSRFHSDFAFALIIFTVTALVVVAFFNVGLGLKPVATTAATAVSTVTVTNTTLVTIPPVTVATTTTMPPVTVTTTQSAKVTNTNTLSATVTNTISTTITVTTSASTTKSGKTRSNTIAVISGTGRLTEIRRQHVEYTPRLTNRFSTKITENGE